MNALHRFGSWMIALSLAVGVAGCPKDEKKDDKSSSADKKSDDKSDKKKKEDKKGDDDDDDKSAKKDDNGGKKKKKIDKKDTGENDKKAAKKADADDATAKKPPSDKKHSALADSLPTTFEKHPVPKHWGTVYDDVRMFAFQVPDDSDIKSDETTCDLSTDGKCEFIEVFPPTNDFEIDFLSFKDASLSQDDLIDDAQSWMEADDKATNVKFGTPVQINKRSKLVPYTFTDGDGKKEKGNLLVFTDVTDNYFLFVESDADKYDANSDTMDAVWQSFTIYGRDYE